ncbi:MAG: hypothetical protein KDC54_16375 [Lewinella sp.]|nr:hypothetical protein [Lewinella sp.]
MKALSPYQRLILLAIILTSLGVVFNTTLSDMGSIGTVFIAVGGLFLIMGMKKKADLDKEQAEE